MSSKLWIAGSAGAGVLLVALLSWNRSEAPASAGTVASVPVQASAAAFPNVTLPQQQDANMGLLPLRPMGKQPSALDGMVPPSFKAGSSGRLTLDAHARSEMEGVTAVYSREEAMAKLADAIKAMPAQAQREVRDLYEQYTQYNQALSQTIPLDQREISTLDQAREQFEAIKKLRAQFFGSNADGMFKDDELLTQKILDHSADYMKSHPNASLQEATGYGQEKVLSAPQVLKP